MIDDFVQSVQGTDITIISQEIFQHDPTARVENLKASTCLIKRVWKLNLWFYNRPAFIYSMMFIFKK